MRASQGVLAADGGQVLVDDLVGAERLGRQGRRGGQGDGGEGGDTINGSLNDETLIGGDGNDVINGGGGDFSFSIGSAISAIPA